MLQTFQKIALAKYSGKSKRLSDLDRDVAAATAEFRSTYDDHLAHQIHQMKEYRHQLKWETDGLNAACVRLRDILSTPEAREKYLSEDDLVVILGTAKGLYQERRGELVHFGERLTKDRAEFRRTRDSHLAHQIHQMKDFNAQLEADTASLKALCERASELLPLSQRIDTLEASHSESLTQLATKRMELEEQRQILVTRVGLSGFSIPVPSSESDAALSGTMSLADLSGAGVTETSAEESTIASTNTEGMVRSPSASSASKPVTGSTSPTCHNTGVTDHLQDTEDFQLETRDLSTDGVCGTTSVEPGSDRRPVYVSHVSLPTRASFAFFVLRVETYCLIIDTGVKLAASSQVSGEAVVSLLQSDDRLAKGAVVVDLITTHDHHDHIGYREVLAAHFRSQGQVAFTDISRNEARRDIDPKSLVPTSLSTVETTSYRLVYEEGTTAKDGSSDRCTIYQKVFSSPTDVQVNLFVPPYPMEDEHNRHTIVVQAIVGGVTALFTGDMEWPAMSWLGEGTIDSAVPQLHTAVEMMSVPHHGSPANVFPDMYATLNPRTLMVPSGVHKGVEFFKDWPGVLLDIMAQKVASRDFDGLHIMFFNQVGDINKVLGTTGWKVDADGCLSTTLSVVETIDYLVRQFNHVGQRETETETLGKDLSSSVEEERVKTKCKSFIDSLFSNGAGVAGLNGLRAKGRAALVSNDFGSQLVALADEIHSLLKPQGGRAAVHSPKTHSRVLDTGSADIPIGDLSDLKKKGDEATCTRIGILSAIAHHANYNCDLGKMFYVLCCLSDIREKKTPFELKQDFYCSVEKPLVAFCCNIQEYGVAPTQIWVKPCSNNSMVLLEDGKKKKTVTCGVWVPQDRASMQLHEEECLHRAIPCTFAGRGCESLLQQSTLAAHVSGCGYRETQCPGCLSSMNHHELVSHMSDCQDIVECRHSPACDWKGPKNSLEAHLEEKCYHIGCQYYSRGCSVVLPGTDRDAMDTHEAKCPHRPRSCRYCGDEIDKNDMSGHELCCGEEAKDL
ncbi:hypothetical protein KIPB_003967 [Kipferlia bialata]|uniref:Metallo-beta-lactamase domain-containing protein n=1 Tax=Kipferlia bialata TaxID=797122 RepID=A0A9K3GHQ6_9EUKA|nr:hypothetical protein KIPB_003967 [Kipferlia bialata]|eukprot:g3967.t1